MCSLLIVLNTLLLILTTFNMTGHRIGRRKELNKKNLCSANFSSVYVLSALEITICFPTRLSELKPRPLASGETGNYRSHEAGKYLSLQ